MSNSSNLLDQVLAINNQLRAYLKMSVEPEWGELCSLIEANLQDTESLKSLGEVFGKRLNAEQLIASLAYLTVMQKPSEARINPSDVALLLWLEHPSRQNDEEFKVGVLNLFDLGQVTTRFLSIADSLGEWELKKFQKISEDIASWMPRYLAVASNAFAAQKNSIAA